MWCNVLSAHENPVFGKQPKLHFFRGKYVATKWNILSPAAVILTHWSWRLGGLLPTRSPTFICLSLLFCLNSSVNDRWLHGFSVVQNWLRVLREPGIGMYSVFSRGEYFDKMRKSILYWKFHLNPFLLLLKSNDLELFLHLILQERFVIIIILGPCLWPGRLCAPSIPSGPGQGLGQALPY